MINQEADRDKDQSYDRGGGEDPPEKQRSRGEPSPGNQEIEPGWTSGIAEIDQRHHQREENVLGSGQCPRENEIRACEPRSRRAIHYDAAKSRGPPQPIHTCSRTR